MRKGKIGSIFIASVLLLALIVSVCAPFGEYIRAATYTPMKISDEMLEVIKKLEGFNPHSYWDYAQYSIGYGSKCPAGKEDYYAADKGGNSITEEYAEELLLGELVGFEQTVNNFIQRNNLTLAQHQYDALISFTYNTGYSWNSTTGSLVTAVINGSTGTDFIYGMMLWSMAGREHILINRRIAEVNIFANGIYPDAPYDKANLPDRYRIAFMDGNGGTVKYDEHGFDALDPIPIKTQFKSLPTGPDENGAMVTYEFDGWYTARVGGTKVEQLDESIATGTTLYAHWKTPAGTPVNPQLTDYGIRIPVTLLKNKVNIRTGPNTYYLSVDKALTGDKLVIEEICYYSSSRIWGRFGDNWICLVNSDGDYTDYKTKLTAILPLMGMITKDNVTVYKSYDSSSTQVATKQKGDMVLVSSLTSDATSMWGKIDEGWVRLTNVTFDGVTNPGKTVQSITVDTLPDKLAYVQKAEEIDVTGGRLLVTYSDNTKQYLAMTRDMVTDFDNTTLGTKTVSVTLEGQSDSFQVEITKAKVEFQMDDGTVISQAEYQYGETVTVPDNPTKANDGKGNYFVFTGWGAEVSTACNGSVTYIAQFEKKQLMGDTNGDGNLSDQDAFYLLRHVYFPERYPVTEPNDYNGDGVLSDQDAFYLLRHVYFPDRYPLK